MRKMFAVAVLPALVVGMAAARQWGESLGKEAIIVPRNRRQVAPDEARPVPDRWLTVHRAYENNLKENATSQSK